MKIILLCLILTIKIFLTSDFSLAQNSGIEGIVYDSETKLPLSGAIISIMPLNQSTSTNTLGEYIFQNISAGSYKIQIQFIGYKSESIQVIVIEDSILRQVSYLTDNILKISEINVTSTIDYGKTSFASIDMKLRPVNTAQDLLRLVPGLFIAQHAGGGKAEQLFLRGFDIDHGTDINISVDGMPVNMTSHAHGQGYADLHFVIPETIDDFDLYKGPYYSKFGDLGTSGSVVFNTKNSLEKSLAKVEFGRFNSYRGLLMLNLLGQKGLLKSNKFQNLYIASEYITTDGHVEAKQKFNRLNIFGKYYNLLSKNTILSMLGSTFYSHWNASGQIPTRAVENNIIGRFGSIDNAEGGNTFRTNASVSISNSFGHNSSLTNQIYYSRYGFNLYSNFTFFLNDSLNGDMIQQYEKRNIYGYKGVLSFQNKAGKTNFLTDIGIGARIDDVDTIFLANAYKREFLNFSAAGKIMQKDFFGYLNESIEISDFIINPGVRVDYFDYDFTDHLNPQNSGNKTAVRVGPKLNLFYNVTPKTQLYIKSGIGFHSNDARVVVVEKNENTLPSAIGYEIGTYFSVGNALINTSVWGLNLESEFVYVGDEAIVEPSGKTRRLGIDFSGRYQFNNWLWADVDLNYTNGKFIDEPKDANRIPLAPDFSSVGGISFKLKDGLNGRLGYRFLDDRPANERNTIIAKGYFIMDAVLNFTQGRYQIGLSVENLLDNKKWNEAQFDTESRLQFETNPVSELHFTPGTPFYIKGNVTLFF
ncbi:MAG: TonB-dependent receptor [Ignavibacteria bacterium]